MQPSGGQSAIVTLLLLLLWPFNGTAQADVVSVKVGDDTYAVSGEVVTASDGARRPADADTLKITAVAQVWREFKSSLYYKDIFSAARRAYVLKQEAAGMFVSRQGSVVDFRERTDESSTFLKWLEAASADDVARSIVVQDAAEAVHAYKRSFGIFLAIERSGHVEPEQAAMLLKNDFHLAQLSNLMPVLASEKGIALVTPKEAQTLSQSVSAIVAEAKGTAPPTEVIRQRVANAVTTNVGAVGNLRQAIKPSVISLGRSGAATQAFAVAKLYPSTSGLKAFNPSSGTSSSTTPKANQPSGKHVAQARFEPQRTDPRSHPLDYNDNLKTFSSKRYTSGDGWVFDPMSALWVNPNDPRQTFIPTTFTCCDDTGLAFPSEAIEAKSAFYWNLKTVDVNCGRLYFCDDDAVPPDTTSSDPPPTDDEKRFLAVIRHFYDHLPPEEARDASYDFMRKLPPGMRKGFLDTYKAFLEFSTRQPQRRAAAPPRLRMSPSAAYAMPHSKNSQSDITGLGGRVTSKFAPVTKSGATQIVGRYKMVPGGLTLEGEAQGLQDYRSVRYDRASHSLVFGEDAIYPLPIPMEEFQELIKGLSSDDRLGVSLGAQTNFFGIGRRDSQIALNLALADEFFGALIYNKRELIALYKTADNYQLRDGSKSNLAVKLNFSGYEFTAGELGSVRRAHFEADSTIVALSTEKNAAGNSMPDLERIAAEDYPEWYIRNLEHFRDNIEYYLRERIFRRAVTYGEVAAILRTLKAKNIKIGGVQ